VGGGRKCEKRTRGIVGGDKLTRGTVGGRRYTTRSGIDETIKLTYGTVRSAKDRDHGRVGHPRDGGQFGEPEVRDPAEREGSGLHILVPEQQTGAGLR